MGLPNIDASRLTKTLTTKPKELVDQKKLAFGKNFTDHMLCIKYTEDGGWETPEIKPYGPLEIDPAAFALNYSVQTFEGMKAYRSADGTINLFRPEKNMQRLATSSQRIMLPEFDQEQFLQCIKELVKVDERFVPNDYGYSLYIRPNFIGTEDNLNLQYSREALLYVYLSPVGPYFPRTVKLHANTKEVRAWPGGVGNFKLGGNYAPALRPTMEIVREGYDQILWLLGDDHYVTEVGTMNFFIFWTNTEGKKELVTAPLDGIILPGVTRDSLLELARKWGEFKVSERKVTMPEVLKALEENRMLEAFGAGTACVVCSVSEVLYNGKTYQIPVDPSNPNAVFGPLTMRLRKELLDIQYAKTPSSCIKWSCVQHERRAHAWAPGAWTTQAETELLTLITRLEAQGAVGRWDIVRKHVARVESHDKEDTNSARAKAAPAARSGVRIGEYVTEKYLQRGLPIDWGSTARAFGSSVAVCRTLYYQTRRAMREEQQASTKEQKQTRSTHYAPTGEFGLEPPYRARFSDTQMWLRANEVRTTVAATKGSDGSVDWATVAEQLGVSEEEALMLAHGAGAQVAADDAEWTVARRERLVRFVQQHKGVRWELVALYMRSSAGQCASEYTASVINKAQHGIQQRAANRKWTTEEQQRLVYAMTHRKQFRRLVEVAAHVGGGRSASSCNARWLNTRLLAAERAVTWTPAEEAALTEFVVRTPRLCLNATTLAAVQRELAPDRSPDQLRIVLTRIRARLESRARTAATADLERLQEAVNRHSQGSIVDWKSVGADLRVGAWFCWKVYNDRMIRGSLKVATPTRWSPDEVLRLRNAVAEVPSDANNRWFAVAQIVGSRSQTMCQSKAQRMGIV
ncbi:branched-chain-amino-acid transaminase bat2 [Coemansia sp. RSA 1365]|nr:branched-chain-amino-acid transaminase bat2 [Coemansia sp. RSA 1365]